MKYSPVNGLFVFLFTILVVVVLIPIFSVTIPPLVDYPNHLARMYVLNHLDQSTTLQEFYAYNWTLLPNLAMDIIVPPLAKLMSLENAGRWFIAAILILWLAGAVFLHYALFRTLSVWPLLASLFLFNYVLAFGFLNYLFAAGIYLIALAAWIASSAWHKLSRLAFFSVITSILFLAHLFALGLYGLSVLTYEIWQSRNQLTSLRREQIAHWSMVIGQFIIPGLLWLASLIGQKGKGKSIEFFSSFSGWIKGILSPTLMYFGWPDLVILGFIGSLLIVGWYRRWIQWHPAMVPVLLVLAITAVVIPNMILGSFLATNIRITPVLACIAVVSIQPTPKARGSITIMIFVLAAGLLGGRIWTVTNTWKYYDKQFAEFRQALQTIEKGSRLFQTYADPPQGAWVSARRGIPWYAVYWHMTTLAVIDREAFVPTLFTHSTQQPLVRTPEYASFDADFDDVVLIADLPALATQEPSSHAYLAGWPKHYDYLVTVYFGPRPANPMPDVLEPAYEGSCFTLFRVKRSEVAL